MSRTTKSYVESIGVYLPPNEVSTADIMAGCARPVRLPLERLTGIQSRHRAGENEFSMDLAVKAVKDCLNESSLKADDIDLLICANISRYDAPATVTYEPSTSVSLKDRFQFRNAMAWDLSNACAGMWTAAYVADAMIRAGSVKNVMIVSGEYITYLTDTAQREVVDAMDPQIASLTLGDAGLAVIMGPSPSNAVGFHDLNVFTLSQFSRFCVAKPAETPEGGAAMHTDTLKITSAVVPYFSAVADDMLTRNGWEMDEIQHVIPHQTSRLTMRSALDEIGQAYGVDLPSRLIDNLARRGNTASTAQFLAFRDSMASGRINNGENVLFMISGSGQTLGTALYTCDQLPDRLNASTNGKATVCSDAAPSDDGPSIGMTLPVPMCVDSIGIARPSESEVADTLSLLKQATEQSLDRSPITKSDLQLLISTGVYRTEFVTEPAIAALLAGDLEFTTGDEPSDTPAPLAFDLLNGSVGFLAACQIAGELARVDQLENALVVASEIENNHEILPDQLLGIDPMASAAILKPSDDGETGFQAFWFEDHTEHMELQRTAANWNEEGRVFLDIQKCEQRDQIYLKCLVQSVRAFLNEQQLSVSEIAWWLPPQVSKAFIAESSQTLGWDLRQTIDACDNDLNLATSSEVAALRKALDDERVQPGDLGLIANVGSGAQVACAIYQF